MADEDEDNVIVRWSRRKTAARRGKPADEPSPAPAAGAAADASPPPEKPVAPAGSQPDPEREALLEELGKIDIEKLSYQDDFTIFMRPKVPEHIRQAALRKLWTTHPMFTTPDIAFDYHDDYNTAALAEVRNSWLPGGLGYRSGDAEAAPTQAPEPTGELPEAAGEAPPASAAPQPADAAPEPAARSAAADGAADADGAAEDGDAKEAPKGA